MLYKLTFLANHFAELFIGHTAIAQTKVVGDLTQLEFGKTYYIFILAQNAGEE